MTNTDPSTIAASPSTATWIRPDLDIVKQKLIAIDREVRRFNVPLLDLKSRHKDLGSSTFVAIGAKRFLMTAGHVIPSNPSGRLRAIQPEPDHHEGPMLGFLKWKASGSNSEDVGYLEVDSDVALRLFGDPLPLNRLEIGGCGQAHELLLIIGAQSEATAEQSTETCSVICVTGIGAEAIGLKDWDTIQTGQCDKPPDSSRDIFLHFPTDNWCSLPRDRMVHTPAPTGMSGGAIWRISHGARVWSPDSVTVIGIQSSMNIMTDRYLRGVQVGVWLRMIAEDYPDCRDALLQEFPGLLSIR